MNRSSLLALLRKDFLLYFSNRFFGLVTLLGLAGFVVIYFLLPAQMEDRLELGLYFPEMPSALHEMLEEEGIAWYQAPTEEALRQSVLKGTIPAGYAFPPAALSRLRAGERIPVTLYIAADLPPEYRTIYAVVLDEFIFTLSGQRLAIEAEEEVLGPDLAGAPISPRQRMAPLFAVLVLMIESLGLANLISAEIETGTLTALLVTPLSVEGFFFSKVLFGATFAFLQALILLLVIGGLHPHPALILLTLALGAVLITGAAFLVAAIGRDMLSVLGWGMLMLLILLLPGFTVLLPGLSTPWERLIPSYYLVNTVHQLINFNASGQAVASNLAWLTFSAIGFLGLGIVTLRRRLKA